MAWPLSLSISLFSPLHALSILTDQRVQNLVPRPWCHNLVTVGHHTATYCNTLQQCPWRSHWRSHFCQWWSALQCPPSRQDSSQDITASPSRTGAKTQGRQPLTSWPQVTVIPVVGNSVRSSIAATFITAGPSGKAARTQRRHPHEVVTVGKPTATRCNTLQYTATYATHTQLVTHCNTPQQCGKNTEEA